MGTNEDRCDHCGERAVWGFRDRDVPEYRFVRGEIPPAADFGFTPEKMPASSLPFLGQVPQNVWCTT